MRRRRRRTFLLVASAMSVRSELASIRFARSGSSGMSSTPRETAGPRVVCRLNFFPSCWIGMRSMMLLVEPRRGDSLTSEEALPCNVRRAIA
eukprot:5250476-Prymnesium_polylepis.1